MTPPKIPSASPFFTPPSNLRVEVKAPQMPVSQRPLADTFVTQDSEGLDDIRPLHLSVPKYFVDTRFEVHTPSTLVDMALRFAAASYENQAGTDEEAVFNILREVVARGPEAKQEFQEILTAMAKANRDRNGISYYEKVSQQVRGKLEGREESSVDFVEKVLRDEMQGRFISAEYKEAMHLWEGTALAGDLENGFEGMLNSIANLGEMALEHPVLAGASIGLGVGLALAGGAPVVAKTALGWRFLSILPAVSQGLQKVGLASTVLFGAKYFYHYFRSIYAPNQLQAGREVRESGEAVGNFIFAMLSFSFARDNATSAQLRETGKLASDILKEWSVEGALSSFRAADSIGEGAVVLHRLREYRSFEFIRPFVFQLTDAELLQYSNQAVQMLRSHPQLLASPEGAKIYSIIEGSLNLDQQFDILSAMMSQPKSHWSLLAPQSSSHPLIASIYDLLKVNVDSDASEVFAEKLIRVLEIAKRDANLHAGRNPGFVQAKFVNKIERVLWAQYSNNPLSLNEAQSARLIEVVTSPEFLHPYERVSPGMCEILESLFPQLNRETNEAILIGLDLQLLVDPGNASLIGLRNNLAVLEAVQRIESGQVGRLAVAQSDYRFSAAGNWVTQPGEKKALVIQLGDSNKVQIVAQAKGHSGNNWYWQFSPSLGASMLPIYELRIRGKSAHELLLVHADAQKAEQAFMKLWNDASLGRPGPTFPKQRSLFDRILSIP